jgi:3-hydroxybutyrate dehydrogenase
MLKGKVVIVTGSTSGIGLGIARAYAAQQATVVLTGLGDAVAIEKTRQTLQKDHDTVVHYDGSDLSDPRAARLMVDNVAGELGRVDVLINNAGIQHIDAVEDFPVARWDAIIALNLSAVFHCSAAVLPYMRKQGWGRIINIASVHGLVGSPNKSAYVAAKHGVVGLTKVIALETAGSGITANAICPGWVRTELVEKQISALACDKGIDQEAAARELLAAKQPSLQFTSPKQLGALVVFLSTEAAAQITGASIPVDGGWTAC